MDFSKTVIRASAMYKLMTSPQNKADKEAGNLSQTAKTHLRTIYREIVTGRTEMITSKYFEHGNFGEEYALTMLAKRLKRMIKKNTERISNEFFSGEPDTYIGETIYKVTHGFDTKCPFSVFTMPFSGDELDAIYYYQNMTYMALTGAEKWTTVYCLINHSLDSINKQKQSAWFKHGCEWKGVTDEYIAEATEIEKNCIYNKAEFLKSYPHYDFDCKDWQYDLTDEQRVKTFTVERDEAVIEAMKSKVEKAREYLAELHQQETLNVTLIHGEQVNGTSVVVAERG